MVAEQEPDVGKRIRSLREQQGLSLRALAERCGLSVNAISLIERGENSPTVSSLHVLALALGVSIADLFRDEHEQAVVFVPPDSRLQAKVDGILMESLGIGLQNQQLEPFLVTISPGAGNLEQPVTHPGEEMVYCLEGQLDYYVDGQRYQLTPGYTLVFAARQQHCFFNPGDSQAQVLMIFAATHGNQPARRLHLGTPLTTGDGRK